MQIATAIQASPAIAEVRGCLLDVLRAEVVLLVITAIVPRRATGIMPIAFEHQTTNITVLILAVLKAQAWAISQGVLSMAARVIRKR